MDLLRRAVECGQSPTGAQVSAAALSDLCLAAQGLALERLSPDARWAWLAEGLMSEHPSQFLQLLRQCGALRRFLPEVDALFGVPQLSDAAEPVDVGLHQLRLCDELARLAAPLPIRFAGLMHKIGKAGTPRDIWPSHFKHESRAHALLDALPARVAVPPQAMGLARLVVDEADRIHRASDVRAAAVAALLDRLEATRLPERFEQLLTLCAADYAAYAGHRAANYPKAPRLRRALAAYVGANVDGLPAEDALQRRAEAIAVALNSLSSR